MPEADEKGWLTRERAGIGSFADLARVGLAVLAGIIAFWQFNQQWQIENERSARTAFREFLVLSMNNPEYSRPDLIGRPYDDLEYERYFWYVNFMNQTIEEVFAHVPQNDAWVDLAETQIALHCAFFTGDDYVPQLYSVRFQASVDRAIAENRYGVCQPQ